MGPSHLLQMTKPAEAKIFHPLSWQRYETPLTPMTTSSSKFDTDDSEANPEKLR